MSKSTKSSGAASPAVTKCLELIGRRLAAARRDIPAMSELGEQMAKPLVTGGEIFAPAVSKFWPHEFMGRAGGIMGVRERVQPTAKDVCYFAPPDGRNWDAAKDETLQGLLKTKANLFVIGREDDLPGLKSVGGIAGFTGGISPQEGFGCLGKHRPLAQIRLLELFLRGWLTAGEMIAACTRLGKMPILWMSVWLEGATVRNASFIELNNLIEPWRVPLFHKDRYIPPLEAGHAAREFLGAMDAIFAGLKAQAGRLATAGQWLAEARERGQRNWAVLVGHSYPNILELESDEDKGTYPLRWGPSCSDLGKTAPADLGKGDVLLHMGYGPINQPALKKLLAKGIRVIHTTPYGLPADLEGHENFLWLDLPWRPADATVDIPGYSVRMMPGSSTAQTMALLAILSEYADRMGWE